MVPRGNNPCSGSKGELLAMEARRRACRAYGSPTTNEGGENGKLRRKSQFENGVLRRN